MGQRANSSLPVRMMQSHAGTGYGVHFPLHPGVEVAVAFEDGDPDRPMIWAPCPTRSRRRPSPQSTRIPAEFKPPPGFGRRSGTADEREGTGAMAKLSVPERYCRAPWALPPRCLRRRTSRGCRKSSESMPAATIAEFARDEHPVVRHVPEPVQPPGGFGDHGGLRCADPDAVRSQRGGALGTAIPMRHGEPNPAGDG